MERKSLLAVTLQEVITTICKGELRAGWERWACSGSHQFALARGWNTTSHNQITCGVHACTNAGWWTRTHAGTGLLWASGCCGEFPEESRAVADAVTRRLAVRFSVLWLQQKLYRKVFSMREISAFVGRTEMREAESWQKQLKRKEKRKEPMTMTMWTGHTRTHTLHFCFPSVSRSLQKATDFITTFLDCIIVGKHRQSFYLKKNMFAQPLNPPAQLCVAV